MILKQQTNELNFRDLFTSSLGKLLDIVTVVEEAVSSEDVELISEKAEELKEISDRFKNINPNELSDNEKKAREHFTGALDRLSGLCSYTSDCFRSGPGKDAVKKYLKLIFMIPKDISAVARDLTAAKKYIDEDNSFCETAR
jgi:hypothetical protein